MVDIQNNQEIQKIEIFVSARSLKKLDNTNAKLDSQVVLQIQNDNKIWSDYQKTEIIQENINPNFLKTLVIEYYFEKKQNIKLLVYEVQGNIQQGIIGQHVCTVGQIVGAKNQTSVLNLQNSQGIDTKQKLILRVEKVKEYNDLIRMKWCGYQLYDTHLFFGKTCPFLKFFKTNQQQVPLFVLQTNVIMNDLNPQWKELSINIGKLADGNLNQQIICQLWDWESAGSQKYMGEFVFTLQNLLTENKKEFQVIAHNKKKQGSIYVDFIKIEQIHTFLDYIRGGTQLTLIIAVDFTASNRDPSSPRSLHSVNHNSFNQYQQAIRLVGEVLLQYDHDKKVPMFGFGAKPQMKNINSSTVMHCFPLNDNPENPEVDGMQGIMDTYLNALNCVIFSGPTLFAPIINETLKVCEMAKQNQINDPSEDQYFILLLLTDGQISDMEDSVRCIIKASHLPLSIIIIGIGEENFDNMHILDGDDGLWDSQGNKAARDLVQFVEFNKYKHDPRILAEQILEELPTQVEEYMKLVNRNANPPQKHLQNMNLQSMNTFDFGNQSIDMSQQLIQNKQQLGHEFQG